MFSLGTSTFHPGTSPHRHVLAQQTGCAPTPTLPPALENMAPSPPLLCALLEAATANLAVNTVAGNAHAGQPRPCRHCPCPQCHLGSPQPPMAIVWSHCQNDETEYLLFVTNLPRRKHCVGGGRLPSRLCLSALQAMRRARSPAPAMLATRRLGW